MGQADQRHVDQEVLDALAAFAAAKERDVIGRALDAARERLSMDVSYVSTITPEVQRLDEVAGDPTAFAFDFGPGTTMPVAETFCSRMLRGEIPNLVPDTAAEPGVRDLAIAAYVGAYAGVPISLADGRVHGTPCCASATPLASLGPEELHFMRVLAGIVGAEIDRSEASRAESADRLLQRPSAG